MARKILLVDDEPLILKGLKYSLEQDGYQTDSAMDGEEALTKFFAGEYDLILLDVMLPGVDLSLIHIYGFAYEESEGYSLLYPL